MNTLNASLLVFCFLAFQFHSASSAATPAIGENIRLIVGKETDTSYYPRVMAVRNLGHQLPDIEREALLEFLGTYPDADPLELSRLNTVKNDIVGKLVRQERPPARLTDHLIQGFQDESMDVVWRDYCLQHLTGCFRVARDSRERNEIIETLWEATLVSESTFAGTALLALRSVVKKHPGSIAEKDLNVRALEVALDSGMSNPSRIAAIQAAGTSPEALELSRALIKDDQVNMMLRTSAIAALGNSESDTDRTLLKQSARSGDVRLRLAAREALKSNP